MIWEEAEDRAPGARIMIIICEMYGAVPRLICSETIYVYFAGKVFCGFRIVLVSRDSPISVEANCGDESQICLIGRCWNGVDCVKLAGWIKTIVDEVVRVFFKEPRILLSLGFVASELLVRIDHDKEATCVF